ncbi:MAG: hypothetical protein NC336_03890 [Clostridium sp.]|nr:hypothetical protein [Clostridium sp.]
MTENKTDNQSNESRREIDNAIRLLDSAQRRGADLTGDELNILSSAYSDESTLFAPDPARSARLLDLAVDAVSPSAMVAKAIRLMEQAGGSETEESEALIARAAALGEPESMYNHAISLIISAGDDPEVSARAVALIRRSAERSFGPALFQLAAMTLLGERCAKNPAEAKFLELMALDAEAPRANEYINSFFDAGDLRADGTVDRRKVTLSAAESGCAAAAYRLFVDSLTEENTPAREREALDWLERSARAGFAPAVTALPDFRDLSPDEVRGMLEPAAEDLFPVAMSSLGRMLFESSDPEERDRGLRMIWHAASLGDPDAMTFVATMTARGVLPDPTGGARAAIYEEMSRMGFDDDEQTGETEAAK